ncbi:MAG: potassium channel protein [Chloroflexi bacterium]|nr:potassium channel protein [Chloroflexota bacterium]
MIAALILFAVSIVGYMWIEKFTLFEALYMTVITLSTVGYGEVRPLTPPGQVFTGIIIILGVIFIAVLFGTLTEFVVAGELAGTLKLRRLMRRVKAMEEHYIVCGIGRVGEHVAVALQNQGLPCVVIDMDKALTDRFEQMGIPAILGDATIDETLRQAGIDRAKGLVAALNSDAENVYVTLSARKINPDLTIVGRSTDEEIEAKLKMAGADRVVSPYNIAGYRIVNQLTRPHVTFFLDAVMRDDGLGFFLEEIEISPDSSLVGQKMSDASVRTRTGANILSILRGAGHEVLDWLPDLAFEPQDTLIVVGKPEELQALAKLARDSRFENVT